MTRTRRRQRPPTKRTTFVRSRQPGLFQRTFRARNAQEHTRKVDAAVQAATRALAATGGDSAVLDCWTVVGNDYIKSGEVHIHRVLDPENIPSESLN